VRNIAKSVFSEWKGLLNDIDINPQPDNAIQWYYELASVIVG
jgi:hypothetical protein